jgi:hypothetical protein
MFNMFIFKRICYFLLDGSVYLAASRTGHDIKDLCTLMEYILGSWSANLASGQLLAEYEKRCRVYSSDIRIIINDENKDQINGIQRELFNHRVTMTDMANLKGVTGLLLAVQLRHLESYIEKYGQDIIVQAIFAAGKKYRVKQKTMLVNFDFAYIA